MKGVATFKEDRLEKDSMALLLEQYLESHRCQRGDIVEGVVVSVNPKMILIDIGGKCDAIVAPNEVEQMTPQQLKELKPGQDIRTYVLNPADDSGTVLVSLMRADQEDDWDKAQKMLDNGDKITLPVVDANKGGVIVRLGQLRGFVPGSQLSPTWRPKQNTENPNHRWDALLGERLQLRVIEVTPSRNRLIFSERPATRQKLSKRKILEKLKIGTLEKGVVSNLVPFGAFVNVKGVDGLLHISELSWRRVAHPSEVVQPGQELKVYILDVDLDNERLGLSLKRLNPDPWADLGLVYQEGQIVEIKIVNLTSFGAFAILVERPEIEGLIHISELSSEQVEHPDAIVQLEEQYTARIISLRPDERRIAFSLKLADTEPVAQEQITLGNTSSSPHRVASPANITLPRDVETAKRQSSIETVPYE